MQNHHSLLYREEEREMFPTLKVCRQVSTPNYHSYVAVPNHQLFGVGSIPWSPLARGLLTRPLADQTKRGSTDLYVIRTTILAENTDWLRSFIKRYSGAQGTSEILKRFDLIHFNLSK